MRLKHRDHSFASDRSGRPEGRFYFGGMMTIVVDQQEARAVIFDLKAPASVLKLGQRFGNFLERNSELGREGNYPKGIANVVLARNVENGISYLFFSVIDTEAGAKITKVDI